MWKVALCFGIGVAAGVVITYAICRNSWKSSVETSDNTAEDKAVEQSVHEGKKWIQNLIDEQTKVDLLRVGVLTSWFRENKSQFAKNAKMIIFMPTKKNFRQLGWLTNEVFDEKSNIMQMFYDEENQKILKIRLIHFDEIESNLQAHLIEESGLIIVTD